MGKKKSKTSKQKQAKAAAKSLKCRVIKEQQVKVEITNGKKKNKGKPNSMDNDEKDDFQRQQASMQERQLAEEQQRKRMKRGKSKKKGNMFEFKAPTLIVDDAKKSTTQLMTEVTSKAQGWEGIGNQPNEEGFGIAPPNGPINLKQVFQNSTLLKPPPIAKSKNPFAALGDDSDEEEELNTKPESAAPLFQFKPASFSVSTPTTLDDVDPDL